MFVYYPYRASLAPAILRQHGRREMRAAWVTFGNAMAGTLALVAVDLHFAVLGQFDDVSFVALKRRPGDRPTPLMAKTAPAFAGSK